MLPQLTNRDGTSEISDSSGFHEFLNKNNNHQIFPPIIKAERRIDEEMAKQIEEDNEKYKIINK